MKLVLLIILFTFNVFGSDLGGSLINKKTGDKLSLKCVTDICNEAVFTKNDIEVSTNLILPLDKRDEIFYHFHMLITNASTSRAPFPYSWYIFNMQIVTKKLRKAFPSMIDSSALNQSVKMNNKNFLEVIKAIENY